MPLAVAASSSRGGNLRCVGAISPWLRDIETTDTRVARPVCGWLWRSCPRIVLDSILAKRGGMPESLALLRHPASRATIKTRT